MKKRKSSAIHPAGCPNGPHQMAIIDPQLFGPVDDCVLLQASGDGMRNAGIPNQAVLDAVLADALFQLFHAVASISFFL